MLHWDEADLQHPISVQLRVYSRSSDSRGPDWAEESSRSVYYKSDTDFSLRAELRSVFADSCQRITLSVISVLKSLNCSVIECH